MGYFSKHQARLSLRRESASSLGLRECQIGAHWAVLAHFTRSSSPALVSLPTGAGKTALMQILSFELRASRVLVVEPSTILRDQVAAEFASLQTLKQIKALPATVGGPKTLSREGQLTSISEWAKLESFDVVVVTPHTSSPEYSNVTKPPVDLFDLVFIDEAHHTPAPTWSALLDSFSQSRRVLLTATPFRRDKRRLQAPLIYSYPLSRALDESIYRPVEYHAVTGPFTAADAVDEELCKAAKRVMTREAKLKNGSKLLVRTDRVKDGSRLVKLYKDAGIKVEQVDYSKSLLENETVLKNVRNQQLDGIVCVGIVGEGLDLPELKVAVLHHAPRSLPFTLQFVGRVARVVKSQVGDAHLIAAPDEVRGEVRKLYHQDANWRRLIPKLVDTIIGKQSHHQSFVSPSIDGPLDIDPVDLKPFHSTRVYRAPSQVDLRANIEFPDDVEISLRSYDAQSNVLVLITETERIPPWAVDTGISETLHDLHVYFQPPSTAILFEYTSSDEIARSIREKLVPNDVSLLTPSEILKAMQGIVTPDYLMLGLRNATGVGPAHPAYKTFMGKEVQAAIRPTDSRVFSPGHALARIGKDETRGIATDNGRVWSIRRSSLSGFIIWCGEIAKQLAVKKPAVGLPEVDTLARPMEVSRLSDRPLSVCLDPRTFTGEVTLAVFDGTSSYTSDILPSIEIEQYDAADGTMRCRFNFSSNQSPLGLIYSAQRLVAWEKADPRTATARIDFGGHVFEGDLNALLKEFPPVIVMPSGGVVIGSTNWVLNIVSGPLPQSCLQPQQWKGVNIKNETGPSTKNKQSIHDFIQEMLMRTSSNAAIVIKDHGSGELADFIVVDPGVTPKVVSFYHCKGSAKGTPSDRVGDFYEVLEQSARSAQWCRSPVVLAEIQKHTEKPRVSPILKGSAPRLKDLADTFHSNEWVYRVIAVQPGADSKKLPKSKKVNGLVTAAHEWLLDSGGEFSLWSS